MDKQALVVLKATEFWKRRRIHLGASDKYKFKLTITLLLSYLIEESQRFGGTVLDQFWDEVGHNFS